LGAHGRPHEAPGTLFGVPPEAIAWPFAQDPLMDRVGVLCDEQGRVRMPQGNGRQLGESDGLYAAGEITADAPRTWLSALESGVRAGSAAARGALSATSPRPALAEAPANRP
jgi:hypothetical protein